jgi:hypothetical protein
MKLRSKIFYLYAILVATYVALFLITLPTDAVQRFDLSPLEYRLLGLTVVIPLTLIWFAAFYGYSKLRTYTNLIRATKDGRHVNQLTRGIMVLAIGLPITAIVDTALSRLAQRYPSLTDFSTVIDNYLDLAIPLTAFFFISAGAHGLSILSKQRPSQRAINLLAALFIAIGVTYCSIVLTSDDLQTIYHLPVWLVVATVVGPYLYVWYLGLLAAYEVYLYSRTAPGLLYRRTWGMLARGIGAIILTSIVMQYVLTLTTQFTTMRLRSLLVIVYILLALMSVGYVLVAIGARRLRKIEEV